MNDEQSGSRRRFSAQQKVTILKDHLVEKVPISEVCTRHGRRSRTRGAEKENFAFLFLRIEFSTLYYGPCGNGAASRRAPDKSDEAAPHEAVRKRFPRSFAAVGPSGVEAGPRSARARGSARSRHRQGPGVRGTQRRAAEAACRDGAWL